MSDNVLIKAEGDSVKHHYQLSCQGTCIMRRHKYEVLLEMENLVQFLRSAIKAKSGFQIELEIRPATNNPIGNLFLFSLQFVNEVAVWLGPLDLRLDRITVMRMIIVELLAQLQKDAFPTFDARALMLLQLCTELEEFKLLERLLPSLSYTIPRCVFASLMLKLMRKNSYEGISILLKSGASVDDYFRLHDQLAKPSVLPAA